MRGVKPNFGTDRFGLFGIYWIQKKKTESKVYI